VLVVELTTVTVVYYEVELLNLQKNGQFPDLFAKIETTQIHYVSSQTYYQ
jgi:hypothetical protein